MKITFLGTSHGIPEPDRVCSSALIEIAPNKYLMDAGAPVSSQLISMGIPLNEIHGVFITHMHGDHTDGLVHFVDLLSWVKPWQDANPAIWLPEPSGADALRVWLEAVHGGRVPRQIGFRVVEAGRFHDDGVLRATAIPTDHWHRPSFAYLLEAEGKRVLFTGDLSSTFADFPAAATEPECDLVVCEAAHCTLTDAVPYLRQARTKRLIFNHFSPSKNAEAARAVRSMLPFHNWVAADGEVVEI